LRKFLRRKKQDDCILFTYDELQSLQSAIEANLTPVVPDLDVYLKACEKIAEKIRWIDGGRK
jgi:hypothetical protein